MASLRQIVTALRKQVPDIADHLEQIHGTGRVTGAVISSRFENLDHEKRQKLLWHALEKSFDAGELVNVGPIVTMAPIDAELGAVDTD